MWLLGGSFKQSTQKMPPPAFSIRMLLGISAEGRQQQSADEERIDMIVIDGEGNQEAPLSRSGYVQNEEEERCSNPPLGSTTSSSISIHDNINDNVTFSHQNQQQFLMMQSIPPTVFFPFLGLPLLTKLRMQSFNRDHHRFVANEHILMDGHSTTTNFNSSFNSFEDKVLTNPSLSSAPVVMKRIHQQKQLQNESTNIVSCKRMGHPYQSRQHLGQKKPRTSFTRMQVSILERRFFDQKYLASSERAQLANQLAMEDSQVKTWFQNRRTKWRRQEAEGRKCGSR